MISAHITPAPLTTSRRFTSVACSECGSDFGPGDHGYSHCDAHQGVVSCDRIDAAVHAAKVNDPFGQRGADRAMEREIALRSATGRVA